MEKFKIDSQKEAELLLEETRKDLGVLMKLLCGSGNFDFERNASAMGASLITKIFDLCELTLNRVCWDYVSPQGRLLFPTLKDLGDLKKDCGLDFPLESRKAAKEINNIKKVYDKDLFIDPRLIHYLLGLAKAFMKNICTIAMDSRADIEKTIDLIEAVENEFRRQLEKHGETEVRKKNEIGRLNFIVLSKDKEYSEEELDELYRLRTKNSDKHMVPVLIMEIMMNETDEKNRLGVNAVRDILEERYHIKMDRKAVGRDLNQLCELDFLCVGEDLRGYWYDAEIVASMRGESY